jgi:hypothetical protein
VVGVVLQGALSSVLICRIGNKNKEFILGIYYEYLVALIMARGAEIKKDLEKEDAIKVIAHIQGELSGLKILYWSLTNQDGGSESRRVVEIPWGESVADPFEMQPGQLMAMGRSLEQFLTTGKGLFVKDEVEKVEGRMKEFLYGEADKPRDLYYTHGKKIGVRSHITASEAILEAVERYREKNPLFPDGPMEEDEQEPEEVVLEPVLLIGSGEVILIDGPSGIDDAEIEDDENEGDENDDSEIEDAEGLENGGE